MQNEPLFVHLGDFEIILADRNKASFLGSITYQNKECPLSTKHPNQPKRPRNDGERKKADRTQNQSIYCISQSKVPNPKSIQDPDPALVNDPSVELPDQTHHKVPHRHALG